MKFIQTLYLLKHKYTGHFVMFSMITIIYNKKIKGPILTL